jgi:hypothetical protein
VDACIGERFFIVESLIDGDYQLGDRRSQANQGSLVSKLKKMIRRANRFRPFFVNRPFGFDARLYAGEAARVQFSIAAGATPPARMSAGK